MTPTQIKKEWTADELEHLKEKLDDYSCQVVLGYDRLEDPLEIDHPNSEVVKLGDGKGEYAIVNRSQIEYPINEDFEL